VRVQKTLLYNILLKPSVFKQECSAPEEKRAFLSTPGPWAATPDRDREDMIQKDGKKPVFLSRGLDFKPFRVYIILIRFF